MNSKTFISHLKKQIRQNRVANFIVMAIGFFFLLLAVLGAFLPVIPGVVFLIIGVIILGEEFFLTKWIIKKSPKKVRDRLVKRKEKKNNDNDK